MNKTTYPQTFELQGKVNELLEQQTREWDLARKNYDGLGRARKRYIHFHDRVTIGIQFNAERIYSSAAKVDPKSISERKCFLCPAHLPEQQKWVEFGNDYLILVNPFPIFPRHLTIPHREHIDQQIAGRMHEMLALAAELRDYVVFYNGPRCGASAPDHFHFQAGNKGFMPIEKEYEMLSRTIIKGRDGSRASVLSNYLRKCIIMEGGDADILCAWFDQLYQLMHDLNPEDQEPMMNVLVSFVSGKWRVFVFPRKLHRPWQFFEEGPEKILLSPASVDLGGVLIVPREEDFLKLTAENIPDIFAQVSWSNSDFQKLTEGFSR